MGTYSKAIETCDRAINQLTHQKDMYKAMVRALDSDQIQRQLIKSGTDPNKEFFRHLSVSYGVLSKSKDSLMDMFFVHSWTIFDNWLGEVLEQWFIVEPKSLSPDQKVSANDILNYDDLAQLRLRLIQEELASYAWDGPLKRLSKAESCFGFTPYRKVSNSGEGECEKAWLGIARKLRNQIVHGKLASGVIKQHLAQIQWKTNSGLNRDLVLKCIYRQLFIVEQFKNELKQREANVEIQTEERKESNPSTKRHSFFDRT